MFDSWSIPRRVGSGFAFLTLLIVGMAFFSQNALRNLGDGYEEYRTTARQNVAINAYREDMYQALVATGQYRQAPSDATQQVVVGNINEIVDNADSGRI
ncbi:MAG: hypothetical protein ACSHW1_15635 [Yoonia sp.]|uniref:hypothetical protein n=1 Tax=Yoonia sp. TaxID=2212373 RepID=UPI003EF6F916